MAMATILEKGRRKIRSRGLPSAAETRPAGEMNADGAISGQQIQAVWQNYSFVLVTSTEQNKTSRFGLCRRRDARVLPTDASDIRKKMLISAAKGGGVRPAK